MRTFISINLLMHQQCGHIHIIPTPGELHPYDVDQPAKEPTSEVIAFRRQARKRAKLRTVYSEIFCMRTWEENELDSDAEGDAVNDVE